MRRVAWNLYALPVSIILLLSSYGDATAGQRFSVLDVAISLPSLLALHLHIWDRKFLAAWIWRIYAFLFVGWDLFYNFLLRAIEHHNLFNPINLLFALPLYIAVFRYATRDWNSLTSLKIREA